MSRVAAHTLPSTPPQLEEMLKKNQLEVLAPKTKNYSSTLLISSQLFPQLISTYV